MGNPDKIFIFNDTYVITVKGVDYQDNNEAIDKALREFRRQAKLEIDSWYRAEKNSPELVEKDYDIEGAWEIRSIKVYEK